MAREFNNTIKNLLYTYVDHYLTYVEIEKDMDEDEDNSLLQDPDYAYHRAYCCAAEEWMKLIGIHPESNYVMEIIESESNRK